MLKLISAKKEKKLVKKCIKHLFFIVFFVFLCKKKGGLNQALTCTFK